MHPLVEEVQNSGDLVEALFCLCQVTVIWFIYPKSIHDMA